MKQMCSFSKKNAIRMALALLLNASMDDCLGKKASLERRVSSFVFNSRFDTTTFDDAAHICVCNLTNRFTLAMLNTHSKILRVHQFLLKHGCTIGKNKLKLLVNFL